MRWAAGHIVKVKIAGEGWVRGHVDGAERPDDDGEQVVTITLDDHRRLMPLWVPHKFVRRSK